MKITVEVSVNRTAEETRNIPDPHVVAEALIEHLTMPDDPDDLVFIARRSGRATDVVELQIEGVELIAVETP